MANKDKFLKDGVGTFEEYVKEMNVADTADDISSEILASLIDHTQLKPQATKEQIELLCKEAAEYKFKSVCVNPYWISLASELLAGTGVKVCTVIGFPLGANSTKVKAFETKDAIAMGATEVDMVLNVGALKSGQLDIVESDVKAVVDAASKEGVLSKVILETCLLTDEEIKIASEICKKAGADYVKTSTGFSTGGATEGAVSIMREAVGNELGVKASGGVRSLDDVTKMIKAGATRMGASAGIDIIQGKVSSSSY